MVHFWLPFLLLSFISVEESNGFFQIFDFRFLMDLHVLGCPEHDLNVFGKCLSDCLCVCLYVCVSVCVRDKNFLASVAGELMNRIS